MDEVLHTPFEFSDAVPAGRRRFWKQVLPVTTINYNGRKIKFDKQFHTDLADSYKGKAFDQVPIVFADAANGHNMDPRNFGGDVIDMEARDNGTWALIEADKEAAAAIQKNPKLGVSARIRQAVEKADGRKFPRAIEHVLLTMNPRVTGMAPWQAVDLSEDADTEVVDLTAYEYKEGKSMGKTTATKPRATRSGKIDLSQLSDEEFQNLIDLAATATLEDEDLDEDLEDEDIEDVEEAPKKRRRRSKVKVTKTTEKDIEDDGDVEDDEDTDEDDDTDLSDTVIRRDEVSQFQQMRINLAKRDWESTRAGYTLAGVPPFLLDLAEPVLMQPDDLTIDLADSEDKYDVRDAMTKMLDGVKGIIDLTGEIGNSIDLAVDESTKDEADAFLKVWDEQYS